ncbi:hypothetical protein CANTEDRAFT_112163 [Yamadazyma tenuis ATCC 10573]|uniref:SUR7-domain-containing protein n=1 Tax=Candida tenuis (strain ATCC 10573 / BCRC 21748 / CBS 615 / JCM 9827 / NBRC 10315 / NRRL Y-1498 / VKM Y-70) TaxID=590646 RepID=G3AW17_CANTC|nr:SUR7-domain-containing protein [Yamadazyma tenuis ATCC 10573]XP_006684020.1 uncharacterized protein CANTEDRAFT_112163 [Yamadazyma tenuis ATCC 10573]EGV66761.1 SUR7-domain-containing protein [Yamadazyma tenuis ATCC 10573]EGV66762.1 hypothetical protein CANTEDRAFT_112163 [Yamadazyma tenuis ATCC 10573]
MLRRVFTFVPVILLLGAALLLFFVNLAGANPSGVLGKFYWSEVDSSSFNAPWDKARWTLYSLCGEQNGRNYDCTSTKAAFPYSPKDNFGSAENLPQEFIKHRKTYYYLSRFAYAFFLIGIVFAILAIIPTVLSCCLSGFITGILGSIAAGVSLLFTTAGAALNTAAHIKGRNAFNKAGFTSSVSSVMFGITWAAVACLLLSFLWMCFVAGRGASKKLYSGRDDHEAHSEVKAASSESSRNDHVIYNDTQYDPYAQQYAPPPEQKKSKFFLRRTQ